MHRLARRLAIPTMLLMAIACSSAVAPSHEARATATGTANANVSPSTNASTLAIAPGGTGTFSGIVVGRPASGNSVVVGGAVIVVFRGDITSGADSTGGWHWDSLGTVTSASNGTFTLTSVPASMYYYLAVQPPKNSPFVRTVDPFAIADGQTIADSVPVYPAN